MTDTAQLMVFVHMAFKDSTVKEAFLNLLPLKGTTRGEDIYNEFKLDVHDNSIPIHKLVAITTDWQFVGCIRASLYIAIGIPISQSFLTITV